MKERLLALLVAITMAMGMVPSSAFAGPLSGTGGGSSPDNPLEVPEEGLIISGNTVEGISNEWLSQHEPQDGSRLFLKVTIPETTKQIGDGYGGFRLSSNKYGLELDFSQARNLETIRNQAAMDGTALTGVLDLSATKIKTIEKSAFSGCTGLTGVILPSSLEVLGSADGSSGSVFKGCTSLEFVRTAGGDGASLFEFPSGLKVIGKDSFNGCTGFPENTVVTIPESVERVGSQAFYKADPITTIIVSADDASQYHGTAFKGSDHGLGKRLTVFKDSAAKKSYISTGSGSYSNSLTYEFRLHYGQQGGTVAKTESKLYGQAANVCKKADGGWAVDENYVIPDAELPEPVVGYTGGWAYNGKLLTPETVLKPDGDDLYLDVQNVLQNPTVEFVVNGEAVETEGTYAELQVPAGSTIGVRVSHPVEDVDVEFEYEWIDVCGGGHEGPRMKEDGFGRYDLWDNPEVTNTIAINGPEHERTSSGNYTGEDHGDGYYLLVIYGYSKPKSGGQWTKFYQSANTAIAPDPGRTVDTAYLFDVTIAEPIAITPADITIYSGGDGYSGIVDDGGIGGQTAGFPEPGYYITLPDDLNNLLGGAGYAADLSGKLTLNFNDHDGSAADRTWELELYGDGESSAEVEIDGVKRECYIYRIKPAQVGEDDIPAHLEIVDAEGNIVESDEFVPEPDQQHMDYAIRFCTDGLDLADLTFELAVMDEATGQEAIYTRGVTLGTGSLVVRGVVDGPEAVRDIVDTPERIATSGKIAAVAPSDTTYYVNDSNVAVADPEGVRLLVDSLIDDEDARRAMLDYIKNEGSGLDIPTTDNTKVQAKYIDLVDSKNGNAYLTMGEGRQMTIYWPVPSDFDADTTAHVVHFEALNRDCEDASGALEGNPPERIELGAPVAINGAQYFTFETSTFSPFVLVYEEESGGGAHYSYTLRYDTNGGDPIDSESGSAPWTKRSSELPTPVKDGYAFAGWYLDSDLENPVGENVRIDRNVVTLYAGWELDLADPDNNGVSGWLETEEHFPFMSGYPDGSFGPDSPITRAEIAQVFYNLLKDKDVEATAGFSDVPEGAWYEGAVNALASIGILEGVGGGLYDPDRNLTRAELAAIATRFADGNGDPSSTAFPDVSEGDWFAGAVSEAAGYGWIEGYPDGTFGPYREVTRAEAAAIVNRMLGRQADEAYVDANADRLRSFPDVPEGHWAYYAVMEASNWHKYAKASTGEAWRAADVSDWLETSEHGAYMAGYPDGTFGPDDSMTRAEAAQTLYNLLLRDDVGPEVSFPDVPQDAWYAEAVSRLAGMGMVKGFDDGTFRPDEKITRAEFAAIVSRFKDGDPSSEPFPDVSEGDWFAGAVSEAAGYGWIEGYPDGTFGPYREVTRAEAAAIVNRMLGRQADEAYVDANADRLRSFPDVPEGHWAYYTVMEATNSHGHAENDGSEQWTGVR